MLAAYSFGEHWSLLFNEVCDRQYLKLCDFFLLRFYGAKIGKRGVSDSLKPFLGSGGNNRMN